MSVQLRPLDILLGAKSGLVVPGIGTNPGFLRKEPREGNVSSGRALAFANLPQQNRPPPDWLFGPQAVVKRGTMLRKSALCERRVFVDLPGNYTDVLTRKTGKRL